YQVNIGNGLLNADMKQVAFFVQDTWRLTPRLTLTAGFRWEGYVNPQPDTSNTSLYNQVKNFAFPIGLTNDPANLPNNYRQYMPRLAWPGIRRVMPKRSSAPTRACSTRPRR